MKRSHFTLLILVILICSVSTNVEALTRQFEFTGTVTDMYDPHGVVGEGYAVPLELYGTFTVDMTPIIVDDGFRTLYHIDEFIISFADISFDVASANEMTWDVTSSYIYAMGVGTPDLPQGDWDLELG